MRSFSLRLFTLCFVTSAFHPQRYFTLTITSATISHLDIPPFRHGAVQTPNSNPNPRLAYDLRTQHHTDLIVKLNVKHSSTYVSHAQRHCQTACQFPSKPTPTPRLRSRSRQQPCTHAIPNTRVQPTPLLAACTSNPHPPSPSHSCTPP